VSGESFFHSFPRDRSLRGAAASLKILRSVLKFGLLLVPEIVNYPAELRDAGDERDKIVSVQRRLSLTMLPPEQLLDHCKIFGPVSLEFSPLAARRLGAMPVMYLPQATAGGLEVGLDQLGYFFSYRIAELHQLCDRIIDLQKKIGQHRSSDLIKIYDRGKGKEVEIENRRLKTLFDLIVEPDNVEAFAATLQALSSLFYPTDEFRHSAELVKSPLYYYFQREWRVLSGLVLDGDEVDLPLSHEECKMVSSTNPGFFKEIISLRHRMVRRIEACTIIRAIVNRPIRELIEQVYIPARWQSAAKELLDEFSMSSRMRLLDIDCE
jgi:hypothetical protein